MYLDSKQPPRRPDMCSRSDEEYAVQLAVTASADAEQVPRYPARGSKDRGPTDLPVQGPGCTEDVPNIHWCSGLM